MVVDTKLLISQSYVRECLKDGFSIQILTETQLIQFL